MTFTPTVYSFHEGAGCNEFYQPVANVPVYSQLTPYRSYPSVTLLTFSYINFSQEECKVSNSFPGEGQF